MNNDKLLSLMGLCKRAGRLTIGSDAVIDLISGGGARVAVAASDASPKTVKGVRRACEENGTVFAILPRTKDEMGAALGKYCGVAAVADKGFAESLIKLIPHETQQED